jgi:hypothetical protein
MEQKPPLPAYKPIMMALIYVLLFIVAISLAVGVWWFASRNINTNAHVNGMQNVNKATTSNTNTGTSICTSCFKKMIQNVTCAQTKNQLFVIDAKMVFWRREGTCADNNFAYKLYARNSTELLCQMTSSIAGPQTSCVDDSYQELFGTITSHLDDLRFGLDTSHTVQEVN